VTLRADRLHFGYRRGEPVVRDVSLTLEPGRIAAIVGPNGAGKSTLLRLLAGVAAPWSGDVALAGEPIRRMSGRRRARRIAYIEQRATVAGAFTARRVVEFGRYGQGGGAGPIDRALARTETADLADALFNELSAGQQQRISLARALAQLDGADHEPRVLLADEPVAAMDPRHVALAMALLRELAAAGSAVGVVLHDLTAARRWTDDAILLDASGRVAAAGPSAETLVPERLEPVFDVPFRLFPEAEALEPAPPRR